MNLHRSKGFTLIELLIIIAIIGLLLTQILPSLNTARNKAVDAKLISQLSSIKAQATLYNNDFATYIGVCGDTKIDDLIASSMDAVMTAPTVGGLGDGECVSTDTEWAVWVNMRSESAAYCVDSTGSARQVAIQDSSSVDLTTCP